MLRFLAEARSGPGRHEMALILRSFIYRKTSLIYRILWGLYTILPKGLGKPVLPVPITMIFF